MLVNLPGAVLIPVAGVGGDGFATTPGNMELSSLKASFSTRFELVEVVARPRINGVPSRRIMTTDVNTGAKIMILVPRPPTSNPEKHPNLVSHMKRRPNMMIR